MKNRNREIFTTIILSIGILFFLYLIFSLPFLQRIADSVNDSFTYRLQYSQNKHNDDIVIVKIDDRTLDSLGRSDLGMIAFDKGVYAELIEKIFSQYNAGVLGIDIVFANPSVLGIADELRLKTALEKYRDSVVIASRSDYNPHPLCQYTGVQHGAIDIIAQYKFRLFPTKPFPYDITSRCETTSSYEGNSDTISIFSRELLDIYAQKTDPFSREEIIKNLKKIDTSHRDATYIDYYSNGKINTGTFGFQSYSFIDIYNGLTKTPEGEPVDLKGKIVLLGEVGTLIHDSHLTPIHGSAKMPGVEINANIITTMQLGRDLREAPLIFMGVLYFVLQAFIIISVLYIRMSLVFLCTSIIIVALIVFGGWMYVAGYIFNILFGVIGCVLSLFLAYTYKFQVTDRAKRELKKQFSSYVSPEVVDEISHNPDSVLVQGEKRNMSIFFSDIVSFTSISENSDPEVLVEMLNEYFSEMTRVIYNNKGTLDKYIGDALMCFFNAPVKQENHSFFACQAALQQQKRLRELNIEWQKKKYPEIKIRIGIHTGEAIHGNIGSSDTRVNYTVIGDSVNLASRLEGVCKQYGISICVSDDVYTLQKDAFHFREIDYIEVKGRQEPVKIFQLLGDKKHALGVKQQEYIERYNAALNEYKKGNFQAAQELFLQNVGDQTSHIMGQRCQDIQDGVSKLNQGVFQLHTK